LKILVNNAIIAGCARRRPKPVSFRIPAQHEKRRAGDFSFNCEKVAKETPLGNAGLGWRGMRR
jgi:hypothetical protein